MYLGEVAESKDLEDRWMTWDFTSKSISVISGQLAGDNERQYAMELHL